MGGILPSVNTVGSCAFSPYDFARFSMRPLGSRSPRQEMLACGIGRVETSDSAFANGHSKGASASDSLRRGGQMPDRTELDDSSPLRLLVFAAGVALSSG